jgi:hypothetical protein
MSYLSSVKYLQCNNFKFRSGVLAWSVRVEYGVVLWSVEWTFWSDIVEWTFWSDIVGVVLWSGIWSDIVECGVDVLEWYME